MNIEKLKKDGTQQLVAVGLGSRLLNDTLVQMFYAFLPILARGLGIAPEQMGQLLSVRSAAGFLTPLFGNLAERKGYRTTLPILLFCGGSGSILFAFSPNLSFAAFAIFVMGLCVSVFQPLLAAYTSAALPPDQRARGMGIIEYGWALSSIVGVYAVGRVIEATNWRVPLIGLGIGLIVMALVFARLLRNRPDADDTPPISLLEQFNVTENRTQAYAAVGMQAMITFSALHLFTAYSTWLFEVHQFETLSLGSIALGFGFVDIIGSGLVSLTLDRVGRKRALAFGCGLSAVTFALLVWVDQFGLAAALVALFIGRFLFEWTIVAGVITVSEQAPNQRSRVMSLLGVFGTAAQSVAVVSGTLAYRQFGLAGLGFPTAIGFLVACFLAWRFID